jgi:hypothetical protein
MGDHYPRIFSEGLMNLTLACAFALLLYDPRTVVVSPYADASYKELVQELKSLPGQVYAPSLGQLQSEYQFFPTANWVALEDMIRGPGKDTENHPTTRHLLAPLLGNKSPFYILANVPLSDQPFMEFLEEEYVLQEDFGDRFKPLRVLPKRSDHGWPRFLYRQKG